uniref:Uncharacterized protein n=1 Tax=Cacopsylla melanoneura TaxID=428564 RepID=A0A8D9BFA2_9HEMI
MCATPLIWKTSGSTEIQCSRLEKFSIIFPILFFFFLKSSLHFNIFFAYLLLSRFFTFPNFHTFQNFQVTDNSFPLNFGILESFHFASLSFGNFFRPYIF